MEYIIDNLNIIILIIVIVLYSAVKKFIKSATEQQSKLQDAVKNVDLKLDKLIAKDKVQTIVEEKPLFAEPEVRKEEEEAVKELESLTGEEPLTLEKEQSKTVVEYSIEARINAIEENKTSAYVKPKVKRKSFSEKYPDLEKFIGENLINKIGIAILVLGIGFIVKYAIDKDWINEIGRVAIGFIAAGGLIGLAHKLKNNYSSFSSVLIGGGLAVLYFTVTYAYHTEGYPFYQQPALTFAILFCITVFAVVLAIAYDRVEVAILAILGGFASPLMVSNGSGNYIVLFTYLMLLNIGMLALAYFKKWRLVNIVSFVLTQLFIGGWLIAEVLDESYAAFGGAMFYVTGFYFIFFLMNIVYNLKNKLAFKANDISLLFSNTAVYFSVAMVMLHHIGSGAYKGLFAILLAAFNFAFVYYIHRQKEKGTDNLLYLLVGLVLTFVTLAIPLQLKGNYITLFWAAEGVLLLWLSQKSGFNILKLGSVTVTVLMLFSLIMDWNLYRFTSTISDDMRLPLFFNRVMLTTLFAVGALVGLMQLLNREKSQLLWGISIRTIRFSVLLITLVLIYMGAYFEVSYQAEYYFEHISSQSVATYSFSAVYMAALLLFANKIKHSVLTQLTALVSAFFLLFFIIAVSVYYNANIKAFISGDEGMKITLLIFRWIAFASVYLACYALIKLLSQQISHKYQHLKIWGITLVVFTCVYLLSADVDALGMLISKSETSLSFTQKTAYAIVWGISSFVLMILGMKKKVKLLRILSLSLFAITLIKLFAYDIADISEGGKIVAFTLLGVLLLIISFMYQKLKKMVIDDEAKEELTSRE